MIRKIQDVNAGEVLNEMHRKKYADGTDIVNVEYPRVKIKDAYESLTESIKPVETTEGSAPLRDIRRDDRQFDRYA